MIQSATSSVAIAFAMAVNSAIASTSITTIRNDEGGRWIEYQFKAKTFQHKQLIIDGKCYSACIVYLFKQYNINICVTDRAVFGFHKIHWGENRTDQFLRYLADDEWNKTMKKLPYRLAEHLYQQRIPSVVHGDSIYDVYTVKGSLFYPICK